jgi:glutathione synthase
MASSTRSTFPPSLDALEQEHLVQVIKDWSIAHGLAVRPPPAVAPSDPEGILAINAPVTLFPSPFPKACFEDAKAVQKAYNELYANISRDEKFLEVLVHEYAALPTRPVVCMSLTRSGLLQGTISSPTSGTSI